MSEDNEHAKFEKLKSETLDLLGGIGGTWMSFDDIASEHEHCDGEIDRDALVVALEELIEEGEIEHEERRGVDEYRWRDRRVEEDADAKVRRLEAENEALRRVADAAQRRCDGRGAVAATRAEAREIGRASCRERV